MMRDAIVRPLPADPTVLQLFTALYVATVLALLGLFFWMRCALCLHQREAFFRAARRGDGRGMTRALALAAKLNVDKAKQAMSPRSYNRTPEPWRPPIEIVRRRVE